MSRVARALLIAGWLALSAWPGLARAEEDLDPMYLAKVMRKFGDRGDDMAVRIIGRRMIGMKMDREAWEEGRKALMERPGAGWDLLLAWDRHRPSETKAEADLDAQLAQADRLMLSKRFAEAFDLYQAAAQTIKGASAQRGTGNDLLYQSVLHGMARSLYGAGRFSEALTAYGWLAPPYPFFRQALFERSWAGFRAGRPDRALGSVASQHSSYFSLYPTPEAYLVQAYLYKRLCRRDDLARVAKSARAFAAKIASGSYGLEQWARGEIETLAYVQLVHQRDGSEDPDYGMYPGSRSRERDRVRRSLERRFALARPVLMASMKSVLVFLNHAMKSSAKELGPGALPPRPPGLTGGQEAWPVADAEDWLDEMGLHVFAGGSQCGSRLR